MKMLSFGEILWDVYPDGKAIGGACLNLAAHAALLGGEVYLASAVGCDELGREALETVRSLKISDAFIETLSDKETGAVIVTLNDRGVPSYNIKDDVAYDFISEKGIDSQRFDVLVFGTLSLRHDFNKSSLSKLMERCSFSEIYTDLNIRLPHSTKDSAEFCLSNSTIVKISDEEMPTVSKWIFSKEYSIEDFAIALSRKYPNIKTVIITMGERGSMAFEAQSKVFYCSNPVPTNVVSTVGAGDSFGAAFLTKLFSGKSIQDCLDFASKLSSFVCSEKAAVPDISRFV